LLTVSVVVPTKNNVSTIGQCLSSLMTYMKQGYINDIVVIDANSVDGTLGVINNYPVKLYFDYGKGFNVACDIGWRNSKGDLVIFLDGDAYLANGFFPKVFDFFTDENIGVMGCQPQAVVTNNFTKTVGETWTYITPGVGAAPLWFRHIYDRIALGKEMTPGGPCQIVRRKCLEAVNGFTMSNAMGGEDIYLSKMIMSKGWKAIWWAKAPLYHHPRASLKALINEYHRFGREAVSREIREYPPRSRWYRILLNVLSRGSAPLVGLVLAVRFRNPLHLIIYPPPRFAWVIGYLKGWSTIKKSTNHNKIKIKV